MDFITSSLLGGVLYDFAKLGWDKLNAKILSSFIEKETSREMQPEKLEHLVSCINELNYKDMKNKESITKLIDSNDKVMNAIKEIKTRKNENIFVNNGSICGDIINGSGNTINKNS